MKKIRIGTRGSKLALVQTGMVEAALKAAHPELEVEIKIILTSGDWKPEQGETRLSEVRGGKGLFAHEIERAILANEVDCGVHSLKDMPSFLPEGLSIHHTLKRADCRDAFLSNGPKRIEDLPQGAVVGTSSLRRQAMILAMRPDLKIVPLRGNVPTRIEKLRSKQVDAAVLAYAGLQRLGLEHEIASILEPEVMLPAASQGIVGIEIRENDFETSRLLDSIHDWEAGIVAAAERSALATLDGSCHTPIGAHAVFKDDSITLKVLVASGDGTQVFRDEQVGPAHNEDEAEMLGRVVGLRLKARMPPGFLT
ncbi:MAG: Porphobilinogen deaminase [Micavibrio sp.]|nr:Porphobilinogen deaminase [Micavibrio sp.]